MLSFKNDTCVRYDYFLSQTRRRSKNNNNFKFKVIIFEFSNPRIMLSPLKVENHNIFTLMIIIGIVIISVLSSLFHIPCRGNYIACGSRTPPPCSIYENRWLKTKTYGNNNIINDIIANEKLKPIETYVLYGFMMIG